MSIDKTRIRYAQQRLHDVFGAEWSELREGKNAVIRDFIQASTSEGISAEEYRDRIYKGNLAKYAKVLLVH